MDFGTIIGFVVAIGTITFNVTYEGDPAGFINKHATITILGGVIAATLIRFPMREIGTGLMVGVKYSFAHKRMHARELIDAIAELADMVRRGGPIALEKASVEDPFLARGVRMISDGYDPAFIRETLERERDMEAHRLEVGVKVYKSIGDGAPAFGMVGTLIGMVQMFMNMSDPSKLGPFMAIALLATLYGAVLANFVCLPMAEKLEHHLNHDEVTETLIIEGLMLIREGKNPSLVIESLSGYLPKKHREEMLAEAA